MLERLTGCSPDEVALSTVTVSELAYGVSKSRAQRQNAEALQMFVAPFQVLSYSARGRLRLWGHPSRARKEGNAIGAMDLMIAAHAKALGATLVSNSLKEFRRVSGLETENWAR